MSAALQIKENMVSCLPSPLPSPPRRGNSSRAALEIQKSVCLSRLAGGAKREADEWRDGLVAQYVGERFSLSLGERAGVRASVELTISGSAQHQRERKAAAKS